MSSFPGVFFPKMKYLTGSIPKIQKETKKTNRTNFAHVHRGGVKSPKLGGGEF